MLQVWDTQGILSHILIAEDTNYFQVVTIYILMVATEVHLHNPKLVSLVSRATLPHSPPYPPHREEHRIVIVDQNSGPSSLESCL